MNLKPIEIKRDTSANQYFQINWMIHDKCTYACSYCPPQNHDGDDSWLKIDQVIKTCNAIKQKVQQRNPTLKMQILFNGGEPTVWKDFAPLVTYLDQEQWSLHMVTNLSRSLSWWKDLNFSWDYLSASYHSEYTNIDEFIEKCQYLQHRSKILSIRVMLPPDEKLFQQTVNIVDKLRHKVPLAVIQCIPILYEFGGVSIPLTPYTTEQTTKINELLNYRSQSKNSNLKLVTWENNSTTMLDSNKFINTGKNNFNGWSCDAGIDGIFINSQGTIFRGTCREGGELGNMLDNNFELPAKSIVCGKNSCTCVTDVLYSKRKS